MKFQDFSDLLGEFDVEDFIENYLGKQFCIIPGNPDRFKEIFSWSTVNKILRTHRIEYPRVRVVKNGSLIPEEEFMEKIVSRRGATIPIIDAAQLSNHIDDGATLILDAVNELHQPVNEFAGLFERFFSEFSQANAYCAVSDNQGFNLHWDGHDVFVVQVVGSKRWSIYEPTRQFPLHNDIRENLIPPVNPPVWVGMLNAGEILYLPRGWWHEARPCNSETIHLSIGINQKTALDLISWMKEKLILEKEFRMDLPILSGQEAKSRFSEILKMAIDRIWCENIIDEFLKDANEKAVPRSFNSSFPFSIDINQKLRSTVFVRMATRRKVTPVYVDDNIVIHAIGKKWEFLISTAPIIEKLLDGKLHSVNELLSLIDFDHEAASLFLQDLISKGFLVTQ